MESTTPASLDALDTYIQKLNDDEYVDFIVEFLKPTPLEICFVGVFLVLMVVGVIGNCLVVYVVCTNRTMWSSMNLFLTNLAVSDLLVLIFCLPPTVINDITKSFWFGATFCKAIVFCQNTSVYVSILTLICVSFERWRAVCSPLAIARWRTIHVVTLTWTIASLLSIPEPFTLTIMPHDYARNISITWGTRCKETWSDDFQQTYQLVQTLVLFILPLVLISGLCIHMTMILQRKALQFQIGERQLRTRKKAIKMLVAVVLIFTVAYFPVHLHNLAASFNYSPPVPEGNLTLIALRKFIPRFMSYSASSLNPILYNFMSGGCLGVTGELFGSAIEWMEGRAGAGAYGCISVRFFAEKFRKEFRRACCCDSKATKRRRRHWYEQQATASFQGSARGRPVPQLLRYNSISGNYSQNQQF